MRAPVVKGLALGKITITAPGMDPVEVPLMAGEDVEQLGFFARVMAKARVLFHKG